jgi:putative intracellular protease/amidase
MTHIVSAQPTARPWSSRIPARMLTAGRLSLHFAEMWIAMLVGMAVFMAIPGVMSLPVVAHQLGMALAMTVPMVAWMRIRGHGWRHGMEMAGGMLVPWVAVLALVRLGAANTLPWLSNAPDAAMLLGMLGIMLFRREHYVHSGAHEHSATLTQTGSARHIPWRRILLVAGYLSAVLLVPPAVASANFAYKVFGPSEPLPAPTYFGALPATPVPDPGKKIAVVLSGPRGSEIGDTMEAYEILARSGVFNVYSVAPERTVLPLQPGASFGGSTLDFVPHFSFAEYEAQIGRAPDVIAIPWFEPGYSPERDAAVLDWIRAHSGPHTTVLGICIGSAILGDTGLLDGRLATVNTGRFDYAESHAPTTTWLRNVRYVDDGNFVTSSNLTAGIDATLHVVDRFAGRATALDVARQIGYTQTGALDDPAFQPPLPKDFLLPIAVNAGLAGPKQQLGVLLYDGVTELGQSGLVDPYFGSESATTLFMAPERRIVRSRDGFQFVPRYDFSSAPAPDRVLVPAGDNATAKLQVIAAWTATQPYRPAEDLYRNVGSGESAYDASLRDLAVRHNGTLARAVADSLFYNAPDEDFSGASWPLGELLGLAGLMLLAAGVVFAASHLKLRRRAQLQPSPRPA